MEKNIPVIYGKIYNTKRGYTINDGSYAVRPGTDITDEMVEAYLAEHKDALVPEPVPPAPTSEQLASSARSMRDAALVQYDRLSVQAMRAARRGEDGADARIADLDAWADALCAWPEGEGFPDLKTMPEKKKG